MDDHKFSYSENCLLRSSSMGDLKSIKESDEFISAIWGSVSTEGSVVNLALIQKVSIVVVSNQTPSP